MQSKHIYKGHLFAKYKLYLIVLYSSIYNDESHRTTPSIEDCAVTPTSGEQIAEVINGRLIFGECERGRVMTESMHGG